MNNCTASMSYSEETSHDNFIFYRTKFLQSPTCSCSNVPLHYICVFIFDMYMHTLLHCTVVSEDEVKVQQRDSVLPIKEGTDW